MTYENNRLFPIAVGVITTFMGLMIGAMFQVASDEAPWFLPVVGLALLIVGAAAFTYHNRMRFDAAHKTIHKALRVLFWKNEESYSFEDFRRVGVTMGSRSGSGGGSRSIYFVQLLGPTNLSVPGQTSDYGRALSCARQIAKAMELPLDEKPKAGFFGKRF